MHTWWPDAPGTVCDVRFAHSPGRLDPGYLNSLRAFDVAFVLDVGGGERAVIGVDTNYHERNKVEQPKPRNAVRNMEVCDRSGAFAPSARQLLGRSDLAVMWLEHLLLHSMLQHESGTWTWGRYVVVHPEGNVDLTDAVTRYRDLPRGRRDVRHHDRRGAARRPRPSRGDDEGAASSLPTGLIGDRPWASTRGSGVLGRRRGAA